MDEQKISKLKEYLLNLKNELTEMSKDKTKITEESILNVLDQLDNSFNNVDITKVDNNDN
jgi:hypothetical protein